MLFYYSYPEIGKKDNIYATYAQHYLQSFAKSITPCQFNGKMTGTGQVITDYLYHEYNTPVLTAKISCCEYPAIDSVPYIWRDVLNPFMTVLGYSLTGELVYYDDRLYFDSFIE